MSIYEGNISEEKARKHVALTHKVYGQLDKLAYEKQLEVTVKGLIVAGFSEEKAKEMVYGDRD
ncbi:hypothetical protein P9133_31965 [Bacillus thuringiensis]|uniref:Uncharacterized protein n=1 Tax=Bacillus thuringiensis HD-771 TaxID=1218175 RepID=A0A9W3J5K7_BACTU|nr:hypothetical protein [Bacillus thuringiensis]AFQ14642.1 hypothetical protein BTG_05750 [Bacillus thuringiensis HD-771]MEC3268935.1 hypothetical protein [Bacillus thuringiensis]MEC3515447.1 hypothetical protein [Bacillus thuringiensis]MED2072304.1 hypothetical protein [Bacillus thuringiensis]MED2223639.1 hypothetical protein [Bacillus thuringiensis]